MRMLFDVLDAAISRSGLGAVVDGMTIPEMGAWLTLFYYLVFLAAGIVSGVKELRVEAKVLRVGAFFRHVGKILVIPTVIYAAMTIFAVGWVWSCADQSQIDCGSYHNECVDCAALYWEKYPSDLAFWQSWAEAYSTLALYGSGILVALVAIAVFAGLAWLVIGVGSWLIRWVIIRPILFLARLAKKIPVRL